MAKANVSICDAVSGNLIRNCGFEAGAYSSTLGGNTNPGVPNLWTPNAGYDLGVGDDSLTPEANSGILALRIGNFEFQPVPTLSQTLTDVASATYSGSLYVLNGAANRDSGAFFSVLTNGTPTLSLTDAAAGSYTQYTFGFTGTGSDVLTLEGNSSASEWFVDDVVVTGPVSTVAEPAFYGALTVAFGALLVAGWRRRHRA